MSTHEDRQEYQDHACKVEGMDKLSCGQVDRS